jgi:hypothetical protein
LAFVAYWALGMAVALGDGNLAGLPFAVASTLLLVYAWIRGGALGSWVLPVVIVSTAAMALGHNSPERSLLGLIVAMTIAQALVGLVALLRPSLAGGALFAAAVSLYAAGGALTITSAPVPYIDVFEIQQEGAADLERGRNPYATTFTNHYTPQQTRAFFGEDRAEIREYPYPPLSLLVTTLSHRLTGDVRWILLAAQLGMGALLFALARASGGEASTAIGVATLHFLHPRGLFVLGRGWTDPMIACALLAVLVLLQRRRARWLGVALGVFMAIKQYSVLALPLLARDGRVPRRAWIESLLLAAAVTLPLFVWGPADFLNDVVLFQLRQPFRVDAMSLPAFVFGVTGWKAPGVLALAGAAAALACTWTRLGASAPSWRLPAAMALMYLAFFLCAKQAFCNYYYFASALVLAQAAAGSDQVLRGTAVRK